MSAVPATDREMVSPEPDSADAPASAPAGATAEATAGASAGPVPVARGESAAPVDAPTDAPPSVAPATDASPPAASPAAAPPAPPDSTPPTADDAEGDLTDEDIADDVSDVDSAAETPPPPSPVRARVYQPTAPPVESDRTFGIEYIVFGLVLTVLVFLVSERAQRLLHYLYDPILMAILGVVFVEYLLLKARDRTYVLEREIELHRRKRDELRAQIDEVRAELAALATIADGRLRDRRKAESARAELTERLRRLHARLDERQ